MKLLFSLALVAVLLIPVANAQYRQNDELHANHGSFDDDRKSPNRSVETELGTNAVTVEWSAPSVRDRKIFGMLIPSEKVWRTGANEATVIHFDEDVTVEGQKLAAGSYALFSIGSSDSFTFIFNSVSQTWGAFSYDEENDVLQVSVDTATGDHQEELRFSFSDETDSSVTLTLSWGQTTASMSLSTD